MSIENTGYKGYSTLLKITNDGNNSPLDINNNLCSESGLPQATKSNTIGDPDYIAPVYDIVTCPLITEEIRVTDLYGGVENCGFGNDNRVVTSSITLSKPITVDTNFVVRSTYSLNGNCTYSEGSIDTNVLILSGQLHGNSPGCNQGASIFPSDVDAILCNTFIVGSDNFVDTIIL